MVIMYQHDLAGKTSSIKESKYGVFEENRASGIDQRDKAASVDGKKE